MNGTEQTNKKSKKNYDKKSLIASRIAIGCFTAMVVSMIPALITSNQYHDDIDEIKKEENAIYEQFLASDEFYTTFKKDFNKVADSYANRMISYEEFDEEVKHLNSTEYAKQVLVSSNSELKKDIAKVEQKIEDIRQQYNTNPVKNISLAGIWTGAGLGMISASISQAYTYKAENKNRIQKSKEDENTLEVK